MSYQIAIDGPAGAGKSTIAKKLASKLDFVYIDTGAMYRALGLFLQKEKTNLENEEEVRRDIAKVDMDLFYEDGVQQVVVNGENVTPFIRTEEAGKMASLCSKNFDIRAKMVELQQKIAEKINVVMDGRDIGTVVLTGATLKIFLTASSSVRAKRRFDELTAKGVACDINEIEKDIIARDYQDTHRENSPLKQAEDAVLLDTSDMGIDEVADTIYNLFAERK